MKKLILFAILISLFGLNSCSRTEDEVMDAAYQNAGPVLVQKVEKESITETSPYSKHKLDEAVMDAMSSKGDFRFEDEALFLTWSALQYGNKSLAVGYKPAHINDIRPIIHEINIRTGEWKAVHDALIQFIIDEYKKSTGVSIAWKDILIEDDPVLPVFTITMSDKNVLTALANLENVRYLEPLDYWPNQIERSSSGCDNSTTAINSSDFSTISPAARLPWNFNNINVPTAWNTAQGQGITIGVIDAGISSDQTLLGSQFQNGVSGGRTITTDYTLGTSAYTACTHGTSMCGLAVGPRNDLNAPTGVAYKSNLHFIRACNDVVLDASSEKTAVKNALVRMGNRNDVRIVSMSIGSPLYSSALYDGVVYANNKGKLIFAAAGTSFSWTSWYGVVYPAYHSECVAVTGVKENSSTCASCHDGSQVDFTVPMERNTDSNRNSLSLKSSGTASAYIGGSSCATAITAGVAALVWSARPGLTKTQVFNAMRNTSQYYPSVNGSRGYGNINASAAVAAGLAF